MPIYNDMCWKKMIGCIRSRSVIIIVMMMMMSSIDCIHLKGTFRTDEFFKFIARFGFQPTDVHSEISTQGYIYGNITIGDKEYFRNFSSNDMPLITLAVIDYTYFIDYYRRRLVRPRADACSMMFEKIEKIAFFIDCGENNKEDFIRRIPCNSNSLCVDEDTPNNVIDGHQFTYKIRDFNQARFWYITIVSCTRNLKSCKWYDIGDYVYNENINSINTTTSTTRNNQKSSVSYTIAYDIWIVNGHPNSRHLNRFEHQYTYELHDIFEIYLSSFIIYLFIMPFIICRLYYNFHYLYLQLLIYISVEVTCRLLSLLHHLVFSFDGRGLFVFDLISNFLEALASSFLILILISIAKGWTIRTKHLKTTRNFYILGILLQLVLVVSHMWALCIVDPVFNTNSYETVAGYVELSIRFVCMVWFVFELKETFNHLEAVSFNCCASSSFSPSAENQATEQNQRNEDGFVDLSDFEDDTVYEINGKKYKSLSTDITPAASITTKSKEERLLSYQKFYLHYGACSLVWFIYLPVLIFITSFVSELYRLRLVLSIRYFVNFITAVILFYIMWSPKTPLKLPGKKPISSKYDLFSMYYLNVNSAENDTENVINETETDSNVNFFN